MKDDQRKKLGNFGEGLALKEYLANGFELLEKQYRCRFGEIDLILKKGNELHFVEVRTKSGHTHGSAEESITAKKKETIRKVCHHFISSQRIHEMDIHIDVVAILIDKKEKKAWMNRYPQAF
jgi:putative endonuclease